MFILFKFYFVFLIINLYLILFTLYLLLLCYVKGNNGVMRYGHRNGYIFNSGN